MSKCPACGGAMQPLFTGEFCPRDCDRVPEPVEEEITARLRFDWIGLDDIALSGDLGLWVPAGSSADPNVIARVMKMCPNCGSLNTDPFPNCSTGNTHCLPCGHVWFS